MKKILIGALIMVLGLGVFGAYMLKTPSNPDQYDKENYIGAADVQKIMTLQMGITREMMSSFKIEGDVAYMSGVISKDTIRQVKKLIKDYPDVKTIQMVSVDGSVDDESNLVASRLVRQAGLNTYVAKDGHIASGGTDFFCAGVKRTAEEGAQVGVHSWAGGKVTNAALLPKDDEEHKKYIEYYKEMEMPDPKGFYFFTINAAEADGMHYMSMDEMHQYGLVE
ncbi:alpha/beta hydrolase [Acidaminobacter sp. JC074]|uniref:COG3904 family protein n=1 Tax=Acidaminobacter sp. JC074 TaxID=2530199 RepID=UPI001F0D9977|nr:hypothetical protein [Acidaminobacter sp. JC074]MCH4886390.1 alpha/beta hydrolase [Acidaminobacter sp. JC074]